METTQQKEEKERMIREERNRQFNQRMKGGWRGNYGSCGGGSHPEYATPAFSRVLEMIQAASISMNKDIRDIRVTELGCGDLMWHQGRTSELGVGYNGYDLHDWQTWPELMKNGVRLFMNFDITQDTIHFNADLVIIRDVFIHLSFDDIKQALKLLKTKTTYVAFTCDPRITEQPEKRERTMNAINFNPRLWPLNLFGFWFGRWLMIKTENIR